MKRGDIIKYGLGATLVFFAYLVSLLGFKHGKPTCENYVINVYLYLALSIIILSILSGYINWNSKYDVNPYLVIIMPVLSLLALFALITQPSFQDTMKQVIYSHIFWILFIFSLSGTFWVFLDDIFKPYLLSTILIVSLIFVFMSALVYIHPQFFKDTYTQAMSSLIIILLIIVVFEIANLIFNSKYAFSPLYRLVSYIVIAIFTIFISYDTARVFELAEKCTNMPNYPKSSTSFFLDILNLFARILNLRSR